MRYASAGAFRTALEARLIAQRTPAVNLSRLRKRIVLSGCSRACRPLLLMAGT